MKSWNPILRLLLLPLVLCAVSSARAQSVTESIASGSLRVNGVARAYRFRRLPVSSFPEIPSPIAATLAQRGCMIPQTWQAHRPENVIHGSFQRPGSQDWAVLCSVNGLTSLLVFFSDASAPQPATPQPIELVQWPETSRLQKHDPTGVLGFNWGIDAATPAQFHDAFASQDTPPTTPDHDSVADSVIDRRTIYHLFAQGKWKQFDADE